MYNAIIITRRTLWVTLFPLLLFLFSFPAHGDENVGFDLFATALGHGLAEAGTLKPDLEVGSIRIAVIVDGSGASFPIYIENNPEAVVELRQQLRRFDGASFEATLVGTPDFSLFFYAPASAGDARPRQGIELLDFLQPVSSAKRTFPKKYVHHAIGGTALKAGFIPSGTELPEQIKIPEYKMSGSLSVVPPHRAHFIVAYGDPEGVLRAIYLDGANLVPFLQTLLVYTDAPEIHGLLARASYLAANSRETQEYIVIILVLALILVTGLVFWVRQRKRSAVKRVAQQDAPADAGKPRR